MIKLYRRKDNRLDYWEAWDAGGNVVVHWGAVGEKGTTREVPLARKERADAVIEREGRKPLADGYSKIELDDHAQIVVQYKTKDRWGDEDDLVKRQSVEDLLNECLGWTGNGHCDGGDIGSGTINTFSFVVDPNIAKNTIVAALEERGLLEGAVLAVQTEDDYDVLWPIDYGGQFSII